MDFSTDMRSRAAAAKGDNRHGQPNLAGLPDVVLWLLFKMLPIPDRGRLACTCLRLFSILQCPSLWTDVYIQLQATFSQDEWVNVSTLGPKNSSIVKKYGAYFKHATILFPNDTISQEVNDMLLDFTQREIKMKLIMQKQVFFCVNTTRSAPRSLYEPRHQVIDLIDAFSSSTSIRLEYDYKRLGICGPWNLYRGPLSVKFCSMVTELVLPEQCAEERLAEFHGHSPAPTAALISNFYALRTLALNLHNTSEELLLELSDSSGRRSPLRRLVLRHADEQKSDPRAFPQLSSAAWRNLTSTCPSLTVECYVVCYRMPPLRRAIKPQTPLVRLEVACGEYSDTEFAQVCREHESTLEFVGLECGSRALELLLGPGLEFNNMSLTSCDRRFH